jgi:hypothetical protein
MQRDLKETGSMKIGVDDLRRFNEILDELEKDSFFQHYKKLREFYEYLAATYQFDLNTYAVDPEDGEIYRRQGQK